MHYTPWRAVCKGLFSGGKCHKKAPRRLCKGENPPWTRLQGVEEKYPVVYRRIRQRLETGWEPTLDLLRQGVEQGVLRPFEPGLFRAVVEGAIEHFLSSDALEREGLGYVQAMDGMMDLLMEGILTRQEEKA